MCSESAEKLVNFGAVVQFAFRKVLLTASRKACKYIEYIELVEAFKYLNLVRGLTAIFTSVAKNQSKLEIEISKFY